MNQRVNQAKRYNLSYFTNKNRSEQDIARSGRSI